MAPGEKTRVTSGEPARSGNADGGGGGRAKTKRRSAAGPSSELPLTAVALQTMQQSKMDAVAKIEARVDAAHESLELKVGRNLVKENKSLADLIRDWDGNGNGEIEKIELRQVVRNRMKIKADNKSIDALFDQLDHDGGGTLDSKEMAAALTLFNERCKAREEEQDMLREESSELNDLVAAIGEAIAITLEVETLQAKMRDLALGVYDGPVESKLAAAIVAQAKATSENDVKQKVLYALDPEKEGVTSRDTFSAWASALLNTEQAELIDAIEAYYDELEALTMSQPLAVKKGVRHLFEKVVEMSTMETDLTVLEAEKRKAAKRKQKAVKAESEEYDARVAERNKEEARAEEEKLEVAKAAKAARKAAKAEKMAAKAKADQSFNRRVEKRRSSVELSGVQVGALEKVHEKAEVERAEKERRLRASFAVFDTDGDGFLSVDELKAVLLRPGTGTVLTEVDVEELVREFDINGDGVLEFDEFAPLWTDMFGDSQ